MAKLTPDYETLQSIYDISDEFYELFLGPTMGYTCGYYKEDNYTCSEAQLAKFDLAQGKLKLEPGMTLLDVGCGWGAGMERALQQHDVNVIGLTLSKNQKLAAEKRLAQVDTNRNWEVRLQGWEEFDDKVDRIVSIGAFEHFGHEKYPAFFDMAYDAMPDDGIMLLHTICAYHPHEMYERGLKMSFELARFVKFIMTEIFPGGRLPSAKMVAEMVPDHGFNLTRIQSLQPHYARTLDDWAANLHANKDRAIAVQGQEAYDRFDKYLTGCAELFRDKGIDVNQFTLEKM